MKIITVTALISTCLLSLSAIALDKKTLDKFSPYDNSSEFIIQYEDVDLILDVAVLYVGQSTREKAKKDRSNIGTRFKNKTKPITALEGNRFRYEEFDVPKRVSLLVNVRKSLERLPTDSPLEFFPKDEQLAYWLNLYNISLLEQLIDIYPKRSLKPDLEDSDLFSKKILTIAGEELSLDDIKEIVVYKFGHDPLLIYGFHQGNIASPDIRTFAYTGENVWKTLDENANLFINSNRGTFKKSASRFRVSYIYEKNKAFFKRSDDDLTKHLSKYLLKSYKEDLLAAQEVTTDITDWSFADLYGSHRIYGGGVASNPAALMNSIKGGIGGTGAGTFNVNGGSEFQRLSPKHQSHLQQILKVRKVRKGNVTVQDLEDSAESDK
jgi:hypothetical protein